MRAIRTLLKLVLLVASFFAWSAAPAAFWLGFLGGAVLFVAVHLALFEFAKPVFRKVFSTFVEYFDIMKDGKLYLRRFYLMPRLPFGRRYFLHEILLSDNDRDPHDHPWPFRTRILAGMYIEHIWFPYNRDPYEELHDDRVYKVTGREYARIATKGTVIDVPARHTHKVEIVEPVWSLFAAGKREQEWGFWQLNDDPRKDHWVSHDEYLAIPGHGEEQRNGT